METTKAGVRLAEILDQDHSIFGGESGRNWLARILETTYGQVSRWTNGARPDHPFRVCLRILFGIPETDWFTSAERALVEKFEAIGPYEHGLTARARKLGSSKSASSRRSPTGSAEVER